MIHPARVEWVQQLLSERKHSLRQIAQITGVSRGSVSVIAQGRRPDYDAIRRQVAEDDAWSPTGPIIRCPKCGGRVFAPCRLCRVREQTETVKCPPRRLPGR